MPKTSEDHGILSEQDVRAIVRLLGEVAALQGGHAEKKCFLMEKCKILVGADCWVWCLVAEVRLETPPVLISFLHGGFTEERFALFLKASQHPGSARNTAGITKDALKLGSTQTRLREQLIPTPDFLKSSAYQAWCAADINGVILSIFPLQQGRQSALGFYRSLDKPPFTQREARIAHILFSEIPWLHTQGWPQDMGQSVPVLSPRLRLVLNMLVEGSDRKTMAARLGISLNTLNDYIKKIYAHFAVNSQTGLMRRFRQGDGGDVAYQKHG